MIDQRLVATILEPDVERRLGAGASRAVRRVRDLEERVVEQGLRRETTLSLGPRSLFFLSDLAKFQRILIRKTSRRFKKSILTLESE